MGRDLKFKVYKVQSTQSHKDQRPKTKTNAPLSRNVEHNENLSWCSCLDGVSFDLHQSEIQALVGERRGESTL